ncbi:hypothetical protein [Aliikangiella coralliicola]|uniref:Uncharacterized protein n=1 Tax=Aliikangiella coralliicola TaxID=2592383 RepID=A0A545U8R9_9GAMM|nr:hypothetical protein [Aliikangiella coralliicola]TQV85803.1 hypothetical protein FLL46_17920 [Aliikangiella coralliicola]
MPISINTSNPVLDTQVNNNLQRQEQQQELETPEVNAATPTEETVTNQTPAINETNAQEQVQAREQREQQQAAANEREERTTAEETVGSQIDVRA